MMRIKRIECIKDYFGMGAIYIGTLFTYLPTYLLKRHRR